jgi:uncharacterized protein YqeY
VDLTQRLTEDMKQAMKQKDKVRLSVLRMVKAAVKNREIEIGRPLADDDVLGVIQKELKQRRDSLQAFESAGRTDLVDEVKAEIDVLMSYLPKQLSEDELRDIVQSVISELGASGKADVGKVMSAVMPKVKGRADGRLVQSLVQSLLG